MTLADLLEKYAAGSIAKQQRLADRLGDHAWDYNVDTGILTFRTAAGVQLSHRAQLLAFETGDRFFTWAWTDASLPAAILEVASSLRDLGKRERMAEFTEPRFHPADLGTTGNTLATVASGLFDAAFYYRAPHADGALFLLVLNSDGNPDISLGHAP